MDKMSKDLEKVKEYPLEKKREFLLDVLKEIQVQYNPTTQSHKLDIRFLLPLVGDEILYDVDKDEKGFRKYQVREGVTFYQTELDSVLSYTSKNQSYKDKLTERVIYLREVEGLSYEEIIKVLNSEGLKPMNGENWYKSRISSFYNYNRKQPPK